MNQIVNRANVRLSLEERKYLDYLAERYDLSLSAALKRCIRVAFETDTTLRAPFRRELADLFDRQPAPSRARRKR